MTTRRPSTRLRTEAAAVAARRSAAILLALALLTPLLPLRKASAFGGGDVEITHAPGEGDEPLYTRLAIASDGTQFCVMSRYGLNTTVQGLYVYRSTSGGASWELWGDPIATGVEEVDAAIVPGSPEQLAIVWAQYDTVLTQSIWYSTASIHAATPTWNTSPLSTTLYPNRYHRPSISTMEEPPGTGKIAILWNEKTAGSSVVWFSRSLDSGVTFSARLNLANILGSWNVVDDVSQDSSGRVHAMWLAMDPVSNTGTVKYRHAINGGDVISKWDPTIALGDVTQPSTSEVSIASPKSAAKSEVAACVGTDSSGAAVQVFRSTDDGATWAPRSVLAGLDRPDATWSDEGLAILGQGANRYDVAFPTSQPDVWTISTALSGATLWGGSIASDPSRGGQFAVAGQVPSWVDTGKGVFTDAEWHSDPGWGVPWVQPGVDVGGGEITSAIAIADLDNDGDQEVVFTANSPDRVARYDADTGAVTTLKNIAATSAASAPAILDVDGDGTREIFVGVGNGKVVGVHEDGTYVAGFPVDTGTGAAVWVTCGRVVPPDYGEVVAASGNSVWVYGPHGSVRAGFPFTAAAIRGAIVGRVAIGDTDGDGDAEIVAAFEHGVVILNSAGVVEHSFLLTGPQVSGGVSLSDLDGNGDLEIAVPRKDGSIALVHHDGTTYGATWPWDTGTGSAIGSIAIADFPGTVDKDLTFATLSGQVFTLTASGEAPVGFPFTIGAHAEDAPEPIVAKLGAAGFQAVVGDPDEMAYVRRSTRGPGRLAPVVLGIDRARAGGRRPGRRRQRGARDPGGIAAVGPGHGRCGGDARQSLADGGRGADPQRVPGLRHVLDHGRGGCGAGRPRDDAAHVGSAEPLRVVRHRGVRVAAGGRERASRRLRCRGAARPHAGVRTARRRHAHRRLGRTRWHGKRGGVRRVSRAPARERRREDDARGEAALTAGPPAPRPPSMSNFSTRRRLSDRHPKAPTPEEEFAMVRNRRSIRPRPGAAAAPGRLVLAVALLATLSPLARGGPALAAGGQDVQITRSPAEGDSPFQSRLAIAPGGAEFAAMSRYGPNTTVAGIEVYRSTSGGATWSRWADTIVGTARELDAVIVPGTPEKLAIVWVNLAADTLFYSTALTHAASPVWTTRSLFTGSSTVDLADPAISLVDEASGLKIGVQWNEKNTGSSPNTSVYYARSTDGGATFGFRINLELRYGSWTVVNDLSLDTGGAVHAMWIALNDTTDAGSTVYRHALNNGALASDWDTPITLGSTTISDFTQVSIASPRDGTKGVLVCADDGSAGGIVHVYRSTDDGATWLTPAGLLGLRRPDAAWGAGGPAVLGQGTFSFDLALPTANPAVWSVSSFLQGSTLWAGSLAADPTRGNRLAALGLLTTTFGTDRDVHTDAEWHADAGWGIPVADPGVDIGGGVITSSVAIADLDDDGDQEVVFTANAPYRVARYDPETGAVTTLRGTAATSAASAPAIVDVDGDGTREVFLGVGNGRVVGVHEDGTYVSGFPVDTGTGAAVWVSCRRVVGADYGEVVAASGNSVWLYAQDGTVRPGFPFTAAAARGNVVGRVAIGDTDGDGDVELVAAFQHGVLILGGSGAVEHAFLLTGPQISAGVSLADLDGDGDLEIAVPRQNGSVALVHHDGTTYGTTWPWDTGTGSPIGSIALGDYAGTPSKDLTFATLGGEVFALSPTGVAPPAFPFTIGPHVEDAPEPVVSRLNAGGLQTAVGDPSELAYVRKTNGNQDGWPRSFGGSIEHALASGDLDGDGNVELVIPAGSRLWVLEMGVPEGTSGELWPMAGGSAARSGCRECETSWTTGVGDPAAVAPPTLRLASGRPNPFASSITVSFELPRDDADTRLDVYDVAGRRVRTLGSGPHAAGAHAAVWDGRDGAGNVVASGVYLVRLWANGEARMTRVVKLR